MSDADFLEVAMNIDPHEKMIVPGERIEKYILRTAFDTKEDPYLPDHILWRQKEQFSDGVGECLCCACVCVVIMCCCIALLYCVMYCC